MDNIEALREDTAKYMGFEVAPLNSDFKVPHYHLHKHSPIAVSKWKPDENSEQADMVEDKQFEEELIDNIRITLGYSWWTIFITPILAEIKWE